MLIFAHLLPHKAKRNMHLNKTWRYSWIIRIAKCVLKWSKNRTGPVRTGAKGCLIPGLSLSNRSESTQAPGPAAADPHGGSALHEARRPAHLPAAVPPGRPAVCKDLIRTTRLTWCPLNPWESAVCPPGPVPADPGPVHVGCRSGDGVPEQEEHHSQRPRRTKLHVGPWESFDQNSLDLFLYKNRICLKLWRLL